MKIYTASLIPGIRILVSAILAIFPKASPPSMPRIAIPAFCEGLAFCQAPPILEPALLKVSFKTPSV